MRVVQGLVSGVVLLISVVLGAGTASALTAPEVSKTERAEVRLYASHDTAGPGQSVDLVLHQNLVGNWHTYWINPGDSGLAPTLDWTVPEGVDIDPIQWPRPYRIPIPPFMNYGFKDEAVLISTLTVPDDWPAGRPIQVELRADWLICDDICVPEGQSYSLTIPTAEAPEANARVAALVARGRASHPSEATDLPIGYEVGAETVSFVVASPELASDALEDVYFFPAEWGVVDHAAPQSASVSGGLLRITAPKGDAWRSAEFAPADGAIPGVLTATDRSGGAAVDLALSVRATEGGPLAVAAATPGGSSPGAEARGAGGIAGVLGAAGLAFLGGLILNLMPCVFPVLALKAVSFAGGAGQTAGRHRAEGLAYGAGVLLSFLAVAGVLVALKAAGGAVGWGFQLQEPIVVAVLAYVLFAVGLNLSGVFEVPSRLMGLGGGLADRRGLSGSFFTGVLAVVVASPCTAPFMGAAVGYALTQSLAVTLVVFTGLAVGFALPLVLLSMVPAFARALPRPGVWMERLRQALAFPMYLAAAWLLWVLGKLAGLDALFAAMVGLVLLALAAWAVGTGAPASPMGRRTAGIAAVLAVLGAGAALGPSLASAPGVDGSPDGGAAQRADGALSYDAVRLAELRAEGRPVFVNFTADWCISCKVNERLVLRGAGFETALEATDAAYMVGDWTRRDDEILAVLQRHGRAGVPLYLVYPADGGSPDVLPQLLTEGIVTAALARAASRIADAD